MANVVFDARLTVTRPVDVYHLPDGDFWRLKWDDEIPGQWIRTNFPATVESLEGVFIPMPEDYQRWFYNVWKFFAPSSMGVTLLKKRWAGFWDSGLAWTNHNNGSDVLADYINGTHLDQKPMRRQMLTAQGNVVRQVDSLSYAGEVWIVCEALRVTDFPPLETLLASPWLLHYCTTMQTQIFGEHHGCSRFPQLDWNDVPLPLLSQNGRITFRESYLEKLPPNSTLPNPYWPAYAYSPSYFQRP